VGRCEIPPPLIPNRENDQEQKESIWVAGSRGHAQRTVYDFRIRGGLARLGLDASGGPVWWS
jgi:hypothetical protein